MARKRTLASIEKNLSIARTRKESAQSELDKATKHEESLLNEYKAEQDKIRAENFSRIGETVYKYFGENIFPDEFAETMELLFTMEEVKSLIDSEKNKSESNVTAEKIDKEAC